VTADSVWSSWWSSSLYHASAWRISPIAWHEGAHRHARNREDVLVIFCDPDGSLLDHRMQPCGPTCEALEALADRCIPVVLCSSRTRAELELIQQEFCFRHPFISESGGAVYIPRGYFSATSESAKIPGYDVVPFGAPHQHVVETLQRTAKQLAIAVRSFNGMTVQEVADECRLSLAEARLAQLREYGEPFRILASDPAVHNRLLNALRRPGLRSVDGGRFHHLSAGADMRRSIRTLATLYRQHCGDILTLGVSAGVGDPSLLCEVDIPILVLNQDVDTAHALRKAPTARITREAGALGWDEAILSVIEPTLQKARRCR
jgi:mannosyl-3-phosphoglycerate phosphatase